jgi:hypothetical protein
VSLGTPLGSLGTPLVFGYPLGSLGTPLGLWEVKIKQMQTQMKVTKATAKAPIDWVIYQRTPLEISPHTQLVSSHRALFLKECHKMLDEIRKSVSQPVFHSFNSNHHSNHHSFRRHRHHSFHLSKM